MKNTFVTKGISSVKFLNDRSSFLCINSSIESDLNIQIFLLIQGLGLVPAFASATATRVTLYVVFGCFGIIQRLKDSSLFEKKKKIKNQCAKTRLETIRLLTVLRVRQNFLLY